MVSGLWQWTASSPEIPALPLYPTFPHRYMTTSATALSGLYIRQHHWFYIRFAETKKNLIPKKEKTSILYFRVILAEKVSEVPKPTDFIKFQNQCYRLDYSQQLRREGLTLLVEMCLLSCSQSTWSLFSFLLMLSTNPLIQRGLTIIAIACERLSPVMAGQ